MSSLQEITRDSDTLAVAAWAAEAGLPASVVGRWVWIRFTSKPAAELRDRLKAAGFRFVAKRGEWAHACGVPCKYAPQVNPRWKYGEIPVQKLQELEGGAL